MKPTSTDHSRSDFSGCLHSTRSTIKNRTPNAIGTSTSGSRTFSPVIMMWGLFRSGLPIQVAGRTSGCLRASGDHVPPSSDIVIDPRSGIRVAAALNSASRRGAARPPALSRQVLLPVGQGVGREDASVGPHNPKRDLIRSCLSCMILDTRAPDRPRPVARRRCSNFLCAALQPHTKPHRAAVLLDESGGAAVAVVEHQLPSSSRPHHPFVVQGWTGAVLAASGPPPSAAASTAASFAPGASVPASGPEWEASAAASGEASIHASGDASAPPSANASVTTSTSESREASTIASTLGSGPESNDAPRQRLPRPSRRRVRRRRSPRRLRRSWCVGLCDIARVPIELSAPASSPELVVPVSWLPQAAVIETKERNPAGPDRRRSRADKHFGRPWCTAAQRLSTARTETGACCSRRARAQDASSSVRGFEPLPWWTAARVERA